MEKKKVFTLTPYQISSNEVVRLSEKARKIINPLQADSGMSATKIVCKCIEFAFENYEGIADKE